MVISMVNIICKLLITNILFVQSKVQNQKDLFVVIANIIFVQFKVQNQKDTFGIKTTDCKIGPQIVRQMRSA